MRAGQVRHGEAPVTPAAVAETIGTFT